MCAAMYPDLFISFETYPIFNKQISQSVVNEVGRVDVSADCWTKFEIGNCVSDWKASFVNSGPHLVVIQLTYVIMFD